MTRLTQATVALNPTPNNPVVPQTQFSDADAKAILTAVTTYVQVQQAMLQVEIGKHGVPGLTLYFAATAASLVALEAVTDTYASNIADQAPTQKIALQNQFASLKMTIAQAIAVYQRPF